MERMNPLWVAVILLGIPFIVVVLINVIDDYEDTIKKNLKGLGIIIGSVISILLIVGLLTFAIGTIGDFLFKIVTVIQNNIGKLLLASAALGIVIWILKRKGED